MTTQLLRARERRIAGALEKDYLLGLGKTMAVILHLL